MANLIMLNNFAHDFGAAGWLVCSLVLAAAWRKGLIGSSEGVTELLKLVLSVMRISFVAVMAFGVVRMLAYRQFEWNEAAGEAQVTVLIVKHIFFTIVFLWGAFYYIKTTKALRQ